MRSTLLRGAALLAALTGNLLAQKPVLTEDFESGKIDPAVWDVRQKGGETIAVEAVEGAHGKYALHVHYTENERGAYAFIVATHLSDSVRSHYFGRAYMKISPTAPPKSHAPLIFTGEPGWPISKFEEIGLSNGDWMPSYQENKSAAGQGRGEDTHRSGLEPPADKWFLLEWEFNDNPTTITMWVDGQLVPNKVGGQEVTVVPFVWPKPNPNAATPGESKTSNLVGGYQEWGFGNRVWQVPAPATDFYYDDIVISTSRIGPVTQGSAAPPPQAAGGRGRGQQPPPPPRVMPKPEELAKIREKTDQIEKRLGELKAKHADPVLLNDVEVYAKAGRFLIEYPELFGTQAAIDHSFQVLDQGIERADQLLEGKPGWEQGDKRIEAYRSEVDGALQPYGLTFPTNYDPSKPTRLYVWLHGRSNDQTEAEFISSFQRTRPPGNAPVADQGQIQLDCFGRINGAGWHWAGEMEPFEAIAAVERRYKIDDRRVMLRGFSQGGEGAWNIALHYPDRFAAAEVGAGTVSGTVQRRAARGLPPLEPFQLATLKIWENMPEWALNIYNLPLAGHDGENDPGQLESSLRTRAQLEKEGFPSEGERDFKHSIGAPGLWLQSLNTGHGTSPLVRQRLDAFLKEWGDKGQTDPDHLKFVTYTTRYNKQNWVSVEGMERHYERADLDAVRSDDRKSYAITTHNISRLVLRGTDHAKEIKIDGQNLKAASRPEIALQKTGTTWKIDSSLAQKGLHKTHALQGPIDDAFLDPFMMVRPTGTPWNEEVNQQAMRTMAHFDRMWGKFFRGHPFVKDDRDVTAEDMAKYHLVLFGDPGSNRLIARLQGKLPVKWTKETVTMAGRDFPAKENLPALIYPNPLNPSKYVVLNSGLDIDDAGYNGDYGTPMWGDYAIVKVKALADMPDLQMGGLFDEDWKYVQ